MKKNRSVEQIITMMSLCAMVIGCGEKKDAPNGRLCVIGSDTLSIRRIDRLAPDSLPPAGKRCRVALELTLIHSVPVGKSAVADSAAKNRIAKEFADQLSRQGSDAWSVEAAGCLYQAVKIVHRFYGQSRSCAKTAAIVDTIAAAGLSSGDSAVGKELQMQCRQSFSECDAMSAEKAEECLMSRLFIVGPVTARIACEFAATAESTAPAAAAATDAMVKGLVFDSSRHAKAVVKKSSQPGLAASAAIKNNAQTAMQARNQSSIKDSIEKHIPQLEVLYKKFLKVHQTMSGAIVATFEIKADGTVASVQIKTSKITEKDFLEPLHNYFLKNIHFKKIPESYGMMEVEFPFEFSPEN